MEELMEIRNRILAGNINRDDSLSMLAALENVLGRCSHMDTDHKIGAWYHSEITGAIEVALRKPVSSKVNGVSFGPLSAQGHRYTSYAGRVIGARFHPQLDGTAIIELQEGMTLLYRTTVQSGEDQLKAMADAVRHVVDNDLKPDMELQVTDTVMSLDPSHMDGSRAILSALFTKFPEVVVYTTLALQGDGSVTVEGTEVKSENNLQKVVFTTYYFNSETQAQWEEYARKQGADYYAEVNQK